MVRTATGSWGLRTFLSRGRGGRGLKEPLGHTQHAIGVKRERERRSGYHTRTTTWKSVSEMSGEFFGGDGLWDVSWRVHEEIFSPCGRSSSFSSPRSPQSGPTFLLHLSLSLLPHRSLPSSVSFSLSRLPSALHHALLVQGSQTTSGRPGKNIKEHEGTDESVYCTRLYTVQMLNFYYIVEYHMYHLSI